MKQEKLRVIHSSSVWLPQTETWLFNQVKYLPNTVQSFIVCDSTENLDQFAISNIHCLYESSILYYFWEKGMRKLYSKQFRSFLSKQIKKINPQILHSHFGDAAWMNMKAVKKARIKHVVTFYGYDVNMLPVQDNRWLIRYKELFDNSDLFLCEGPYMANRLIQLGCSSEKVKVHHLGVEVGAIEYKPRIWKTGTPLKVLIAATFREKKGIPYALEALGELKGYVPLEITVIGDSTQEDRSRKEKQRIMEIIEKYSLSSTTRLLGFKPFSILFEEAYKHHVFLSPSVTASDGDTEGGAPVSIIEMIATGMPVVSTLHCDIPEVVQYGMKDWLVKERDVAGLVNRLKWLVDHPEGWKKFLTVGRKHIELEFNVIEQGKRLLNYYREVVV